MSPTAVHQRYMADLAEQSKECHGTGGVPERMLLEERRSRLHRAGLSTSSVGAALRASATTPICSHGASPVMGTPVNMSELPMAGDASIGVRMGRGRRFSNADHTMASYGTWANSRRSADTMHCERAHAAHARNSPINGSGGQYIAADLGRWSDGTVLAAHAWNAY